MLNTRCKNKCSSFEYSKKICMMQSKDNFHSGSARSQLASRLAHSLMRQCILKVSYRSCLKTPVSSVEQLILTEER